MRLPWFDAHLDLAALALGGRNMLVDPRGSGGEFHPAAITLPSLYQGEVRWALGTIFTESGAPQSPYGYAGPHDAARAHQAAVLQLDQYLQWERAGCIRIVRDGSAMASSDRSGPDALDVILLMEGADPIREPEEAAWWWQQGVRAVGLAWSRGSRYAAGNSPWPGQAGLTPLGRELLASLDALGMIHDLSHLDDQSAWQVLQETRGPLVVSHTTSRSQLGSDQHRFISDSLLCEVNRRGGMVGLALYSPFLTRKNHRADMQEVLDHLERLTQVMGHRQGIGLGSDMDGGFSRERLPAQINRPADLKLLAQGLSQRGWTDQDIHGFACGNWLNFMQKSLGGKG